MQLNSMMGEKKRESERNVRPKTARTRTRMKERRGRNEPVVDEAPTGLNEVLDFTPTHLEVLREDPGHSQAEGLVGQSWDELPEEGGGEDLLLRKHPFTEGSKFLRAKVRSNE